MSSLASASPPLPTTFPLFSSLPPELQLLIWDHAASSESPQMHFLLQLPRTTTALPSPSPDQLVPLTLIPHPQSGALSKVRLSLACRAALDAVRRNDKGIEKKTVLSTVTEPGQVEGEGGDEETLDPMSLGKSVSLTLDLTKDLICFGSPDAELEEVRTTVRWAHGMHVVFSEARKFAVRYAPGWECPGRGPLQHDVTRPARVRGMGRPMFCSRCVAGLVGRFGGLQEFYLIVDGEGDGREERDALKRKVFRAYGKTYFSVGLAPGGKRVYEAYEVLQKIKANLMDPRSRRPTKSNITFGLLSCRDDEPS